MDRSGNDHSGTGNPKGMGRRPGSFGKVNGQIGVCGLDNLGWDKLGMQEYESNE